jgi:hypothetical protein
LTRTASWGAQGPAYAFPPGQHVVQLKPVISGKLHQALHAGPAQEPVLWWNTQRPTGCHFTEAQQVAAAMQRAVQATLAEHHGLCATVPSQAQ